MRDFLFAILVVVSATLLEVQSAMGQESLYKLSAESIDGRPVALSEFNGKVSLVVNVASQCGYTSQYAGLQSLYEKYGPRGFTILGFPSNDFGSQEPGSNEQIKNFCSSSFGVTFPLFAKIPVLGSGKHPAYQYLTAATGGAEVAWNFEKFLVDRSGRVVARFPSSVSPESAKLTQAIEEALG